MQSCPAFPVKQISAPPAGSPARGAVPYADAVVTTPSLDPAALAALPRALPALLDGQRGADLHLGAQCYVSLEGHPLVDAAVGDAAPGRPLRADDLMLWYSAGKVLTAIAVLRLWERGRLGLDDRIGRYVPDWGGGKERATVRHVLTHTGGFRMWGAHLYDEDVSFDESLARIAAHPAEWEPGTKAGYHPFTGWLVLGAVVEAVDGRRIDRFVTEEILAPLGLTECFLGVPLAEQERLGDRIVPVHWKGHMMVRHRDGELAFVPYRIDWIHNEPRHVAKVEPGGNVRGSARALGRVYESLLGHGPPLLEPRTVEVLGAVHRRGLRDRTFMTIVPWGLGVEVAEGFAGGVGRRVFGHGGMMSSVGFADPDLDLVVVVVTNGLPGFLEHDRRMFEATDLVYRSLGEDAQLVRRPVRTLAAEWGFAKGTRRPPDE